MFIKTRESPVREIRNWTPIQIINRIIMDFINPNAPPRNSFIDERSGIWFISFEALEIASRITATTVKITRKRIILKGAIIIGSIMFAIIASLLVS